MAIWQALDEQRPPPRAVPLVEPGAVLIWRRGHRPHFRSLDVPERQLLVALREGLSFATMCERLAADFPEVDAVVQAGTFLRRWIDEELLRGVVDPAPGELVRGLPQGLPQAGDQGLVRRAIAS